MVASDEKSEVSAEESIVDKASEEGVVMEEDKNAEILCLNPASLIMIEIEVDGSKFKALLDSGASRTLIKESVGAQRDRVMDRLSDQCVIGLGEGAVNTKCIS